MIKQIGLPLRGRPILLITRMITDRIGLHSVLLPLLTCPPTIYFKFITKCDKCFYKVRQLFLLQSAMVCYYKVRQLFYYKVRQVLLQTATGITKCDNFITKCDRYYKVRRLLQSATVHGSAVLLKHPGR